MIKLNAGFSRKVGEANYSSRGASVNVELEVESGLIGDPEALASRIRNLFDLARRSVDAELNPHPQTDNGRSRAGNQEGGRQPLRMLVMVDEFTRECLAVRAGRGFSGNEVVRILERVTRGRSKPAAICADNGPEFTSKRLDQWAYWNGVELDFSRPGQANGQCLHRIIQREVAGRVPERKLVLVFGRCPGETGRLAMGLQSNPTTQRVGESGAHRVR